MKIVFTILALSLVSTFSHAAEADSNSVVSIIASKVAKKTLPEGTECASSAYAEKQTTLTGLDEQGRERIVVVSQTTTDCEDASKGSVFTSVTLISGNGTRFPMNMDAGSSPNWSDRLKSIQNKAGTLASDISKAKADCPLQIEVSRFGEVKRFIRACATFTN